MLIPALVFSSMLFLIGYIGNTQVQTIYEIEKDLIIGEQIDANIFMQSETFYKHKLESLMVNDEVYLDKDLKIWDLCLLLNIKKDSLIKLLKEEFKQDFNTFVNSYRIIKAKKILKSAQAFSMQEISERSGFYSVSEFISMYKKFEKKSPVIL